MIYCTLIGAWQAVRLSRGPSNDDASLTLLESPPEFVSDYILDPSEIDLLELDIDEGFDLSGGPIVRLERVTFGHIDRESPQVFNIRLTLTNTTDRPWSLDLTHRFFELTDNQSRDATLVYFCCESRGEILGPSQSRGIQFFFVAPPGWYGKEISAQRIMFRVAGLLPIVRAVWTWLPLATAAD